MRAFFGLCLASIIALAGCTSIPLATALSLSSMIPRSLAELDPAQVLVRISLPVGFELNVPATRLDLQLKAPGTSKTAAVDLIAVTVSRSVRPGGLLSPDVPVLTYLLRLTPGKPAASGTAAFLSLPPIRSSSNLSYMCPLLPCPPRRARQPSEPTLNSHRPSRSSL